MITEELKRVILNELELDDFDLKDDTVANEVPGWDSLKHLNIIIAIEKNFNIKFKGKEIMKVQNVGNLQKLIDSKLE